MRTICRSDDINLTKSFADEFDAIERAMWCECEVSRIGYTRKYERISKESAGHILDRIFGGTNGHRR